MALGAVPLVLAAGVAVDMARASHEAQSFQTALDASVFAIAASDRSNIVGLTSAELTARKAELKALAQTYLDKNFDDRFSTQVPVTLEVGVDSDTSP